VNQAKTALSAEKDINERANANALSGSSRAFTAQLWKAVGLAPKLMGSKRQRFLQKHDEPSLAAFSEFSALPSSSRSARAANRACRQRLLHAQEEAQRQWNPKCWKVTLFALGLDIAIFGQLTPGCAILRQLLYRTLKSRWKNRKGLTLGNLSCHQQVGRKFWREVQC